MIHSNEDEIARIADRLTTYMRTELNDPKMEYDSPITQLQGGFETAIFQFDLAHFRKELNKRFVLRLYPKIRGSESASRGYIVQNTMANEGYPSCCQGVLSVYR